MSGFPEYERYIASLPHGLDSFPECRCRSDISEFIFHAFAPVFEKRQWKKDTPEALHTPGSGQWRSDVHLAAWHCLLRDCSDNDESFLDFIYRANMKLFQTPFMRLVVNVLSPSLLVSGATKRWAKMRQGTTLTNGGFEENNNRIEVALTLRTPAGLYPPPMKRALAKAFQAAVDAAKATGSQATVTHSDGEVTLFSVAWDR